MEIYIYSVYAGGAEINDYYLPADDAFKLADEYITSGYDDVKIAAENIFNGAITWLNYDQCGVSAYTEAGGCNHDAN